MSTSEPGKNYRVEESTITQRLLGGDPYVLIEARRDGTFALDAHGKPDVLLAAARVALRQVKRARRDRRRQEKQDRRP
jgi:hypothetical protein